MTEIEKILETNKPLVNFVINNYYPYYRDNEDIFQIGMIGLWQASKSYNKSMKTKFNTYAARCIRNSINREIQSNYTDKRIINSYNICDSLNREVVSPNGGSEELIDFVEDKNPHSSVADLKQYYDNLSDDGRIIFSMKIAGHDYATIALKIGLSRETIRRKWKRMQREVVDECL